MKTEEKVMAIIHRYDSDAKVDDQLKDDLMFDSLDMAETAMKRWKTRCGILQPCRI